MFSDHLSFTMKNLCLAAIVATVTIFLSNGEAAVLSECPAIDGKLVTHIPDETNCHRFYKCHMGRKKLINCPTYQAGLTTAQLCFNPDLQVCDWPSNVSCCKNDVIPTTQPPPDTSYKCIPGRSYKAPFEGRCDLYHFCDKDGNHMISSCLENEYFNPKIMDCDLKANVPNCP